MSGIYVHVPWCRAICPYCAFNVHRQTSQTPWQAFVDGVLRDQDRLQSLVHESPSTLYLGGGTPSRLPAPALTRLIQGLGPFPTGAELTAEANPEDLDERWIAAALEAGITRLSIGVQSFTPSTARLLGRGHTGPDAGPALQRVARAGFHSWSADLIFAVPGQSVSDLEADLDALLATEPPHVSLYGLTFEAGTPFESRRAAGKLSPAPDDTWRQMYDLLVDRLEAAGLDRYEVSNFARAGHQSAHNLHYWTGRPYLGLGPGAHGFASDGRRWVNLADPAAWMAAEDPRATTEQPTAQEAAMDRLISRLRGVDGLTLAELGWPMDPGVVSGLQRRGLLIDHPNRLALSHQAFPVADAVVLRLIEGLADA